MITITIDNASSEQTAEIKAALALLQDLNKTDNWNDDHWMDHSRAQRPLVRILGDLIWSSLEQMKGITVSVDNEPSGESQTLFIAGVRNPIRYDDKAYLKPEEVLADPQKAAKQVMTWLVKRQGFSESLAKAQAFLAVRDSLKETAANLKRTRKE